MFINRVICINFISDDWPAYIFMMLFVVFYMYVIFKGNSKKNIEKKQK
jgi:hypothetical protein